MYEIPYLGCVFTCGVVKHREQGKLFPANNTTKRLEQQEISSTLLLPESIMVTCNVVLTFESVVEILWCDHSNETSSAVLLRGTMCFLLSYKMKVEMFLEFWFMALLG